MKNIKNKVNINKPSEVSTITNEKSKKLISNINCDKNILINEDYTKNFIDFDIKVKQEINDKKPKILKQNTLANNLSNTTTFKDKDVSTYFKQIEQIVQESYTVKIV